MIFFGKRISVWMFLVSALAFSTGVGVAVNALAQNSIPERVSSAETKINNLDTAQTRTLERFDRIDKKIDEQTDSINEIRGDLGSLRGYGAGAVCLLTVIGLFGGKVQFGGTRRYTRNYEARAHEHDDNEGSSK